jgi:tRNA-Thr(GGU) m(6)t(6)A37 methyltransferase TsaA
MTPQTFAYHPIGIIHSPFEKPSGAPIQGVFRPEAEGMVEVFAEFAEGLRDIELFSHVYLLYAFHRAARVSLSVVPFLDKQEHGVFATRAPCRPNALGLSIVRLVSREGCRIRVAELDVLDGTPLLDIKPYIPRFDHRADAASGWLTTEGNERIAREADGRFTAE